MSKRKSVEIIAAECMPDYIHMFVSISPNISVSEFMGYLKGNSSLMIFDRHVNLKYKYGNRKFRCRGYYVDSVGKNVFVDENVSQSAKSEKPKCQIDTLKCTLEELAVLDLIKKNPSVKQTELAEQTGKFVRSVKRIIDSLKEKQYIRRVDGKRYGKWKLIV